MGAADIDPEAYQATRMVPLEVKACLGLWAAVMQVAIEDSRGRGPLPTGLTREKRPLVVREIRDRAAAWLSSPEESVGTFLWICTLLDLNPQAVRAAVARRTEAPPP